MIGKGITFNTEVTNGTCPLCHNDTIFVSLHSHVYRCITCGADTKQEVNGQIRFMPLATSGIGKTPVMKLMDEDGPK